jgi:putative ABC transport system permease protein
MPRWMQALRMRARALARADSVDRDLAHEIREHVEHLTEENVRRGMTIEEARAAARREFGPVTQIVEASRDARGVAWVTTVVQDARYGIRLMYRSPGFTAAAILTIALGIGATTAMFSVVYSVLLSPLPYGEPDRLVTLWSTAPKRGLPRAFVGMANVYDWRARNHVFDGIAAVRAVRNFNLLGAGEPERLFGAGVSANLFPVLHVSALVGRTFTEDEDEIGHERVAILSYGLWKRRFAGDPAVVGRTISLSGTPYTVVGVTGPDFAYPSREYQIYTPLTFDPEELVNRMNYSYLSVARLKSGVTLEQARAEMDVVSAQLAREHPRENDGIGALVVPMLEDGVETVRTPLYVLFAAVLAMLLIGCANLTNLLIARAQVRQREFAVRAALGAGRLRLVTQSVAELVPMLLLGGVLGIVGAAWAVRALVPMLPADIPRVENIGLHPAVIAGAVAMLGAIALFVGISPALVASRQGRSASIGDLTRTSTGAPRRAMLRDMLVIAEIAATLWLAIGATLLTRSFAELKRVSPGFNAEGVYSLHLAIPRTKYESDRAVADFCRRVVERVQALPGVVSAAMVNRLPLAGGTQTWGVEFEGVNPADPTKQIELQVDSRPVTPDYFKTLQVPLIAGRTFSEADDENAPRVGIIDERLAKRIFGDANPLGRRFHPPMPARVMSTDSWYTIVGVVGHIRHDRLEEDGRAQVYWSYKQFAQDREALVVRVQGDPAAAASSIVEAIRAVDPDQPVYDARTLEAVVDRSVASRRLQTMVLGGFAAIALLLASIGVYGVIAYGVGQRQREFGIRLALGARGSGIVGLVIRNGLLLFAAGAAIGLLAAAATARTLSRMLFKVPSSDVASFTVATLVLLLVAVVACALPARRAARVDPARALRAE